MTTELTKTFETEIAESYKKYIDAGTNAGLNLVAAANLCRQIGLDIQEWVESENKQGSFSSFDRFFIAHKKSFPFTIDAAKTFISRANAMPDPAKTLHDVRKYFQTDMVTVGLIEVPHREEQQSASQKSPFIVITTKLMDAKEKIDEWLKVEPIESWPWERKKSVKAQLSWAVELNSKL